MKALFTLTLIFFSLFVKGDSWTRKADLGGVGRESAISFSIGAKGYVGCGIQLPTLNDFWEYDPSSDTWTQKADCPIYTSNLGFGFSILNKGYAGLFGSFYEYDPLTNVWTSKAPYPDSLQTSDIIGFSIGNFGYAGFCYWYDPFGYPFWRYDPVLDSWSMLGYSLVGGDGVVAFSIGTIEYIGVFNMFFEYNSQDGTFTQKASVPDTVRIYASGFSICNKGYVALGEESTTYNYLNDLWEYDTTANQWTQKTNFPGNARSHAACFTVGNNAYIGTGWGLSGQYAVDFKDFYEYIPDSNACSTTGINELSSSAFQFQVWPNPASQSAVISWQSLVGKEIEIEIFDVAGKKVFSSGDCFASLAMTATIDISSLSEGLYFIIADDGRERAVRKFMKE